MHHVLKLSVLNTFAISSTSRFVMRYNLTTLRRREAVQPFLGRPITFVRFCEICTSCVPRPRLRFSGEPRGEVVEEGMESSIESGERLKMEKKSGVEGLEMSGLMEADIASTPI